MPCLLLQFSFLNRLYSSKDVNSFDEIGLPCLTPPKSKLLPFGVDIYVCITVNLDFLRYSDVFVLNTLFDITAYLS